MRTLILGAGGVGGYFGARLVEAGRDVSFLVRPERAKHIQARGLRVVSPLGDAHVAPMLLTRVAEGDTYDLILLSCKAYDLDSALDVIAPAVGEHSLVLPLLNGIAHLDRLDARFGRDSVLGGVAHISVTATGDGEIRHLNELHRLTTGARDEHVAARARELTEPLAVAGIDFVLTDRIDEKMWEKFAFLTTLAAATCTMRAPVGAIVRARGGERFMLALLDECIAVARAAGHEPTQAGIATYRQHLTDCTSPLGASMLRDIERKGPTEAEHIVGDMVRRAISHGIATPALDVAYAHLQAYALCRESS